MHRHTTTSGQKNTRHGVSHGALLAKQRAVALADSHPPIAHRLYRIMEVAAYLAISEDQVAHLIECGDLLAVNISQNPASIRKHLRVRGDSIVAFIENREHSE